MGIPESLFDALRPVTVVVGHYGAGKTNFSVNLAIDLAAGNAEVTLIDLDVVNPYFRASEQRNLLTDRGVKLVAPVFAEAGSSLDVPSLTGQIEPAIASVGENDYVIIDAGGDDVGATALGRYSRLLNGQPYAMLYVANRFRNLVQDPADALENLREIEEASRLKATAVINNSHLQDETSSEDVIAGISYAHEVAEQAGLPLVATTVVEPAIQPVEDVYRISRYVKAPW